MHPGPVCEFDRLIIDHAELKPDCFRSGGNRIVGHADHEAGLAKDVDDIRRTVFFGVSLQGRIRLHTVECADPRIDRSDRIPGLLAQITENAVARPEMVVGCTHDRDGFGALEQPADLGRGFKDHRAPFDKGAGCACG